jgi:hypothetical protein
VIEPVPVEFNGIRYRSALEADWAATLTELGVYFQYEPAPLRLDSGAVYDCDFYLPTMRTYCEAKGPHNERIWKPRELAAVLAANETIPREYQVVVLRAAGPHGSAVWEQAVVEHCDGVLLLACPHCSGVSFTDVWPGGEMFCRRCFAIVEDTTETVLYVPDDGAAIPVEWHTQQSRQFQLLPMVRAPRWAA